jgi:hypothetical protein
MKSDKKIENKPQPIPEESDINDNNLTNLIKKSSHPNICMFTIGFKFAAILSFILLDVFISSETLAYLIVILLGAVDFYVTKNISGRLLVGLRWWNEVKEDGSEVWIFESKNESILYIYNRKE